MKATTHTIIAVNEAIAHLKKGWPQLRRTASTAIIHSGSKRTIFGCLCGARHTASTVWNGREAKHVWDWRSEHSDCAINLANRDLMGEKIDLHFGR
jgi:hypothetical protein